MYTFFQRLFKLWPLVILATIAIIANLIWQNSLPRKMIFSNSIEAKDVEISSKVNGRISKIFIKEGEQVQAGQNLLILEGDEIKAQMEQAKASLKKSESELLDLRKGSRSQEVNQAEANTAMAQALLEQSKAKYGNDLADFNRMEGLYKKGAISEQSFNKYKTQKSVSENDVKSYEEELIKAKENESLVKEGPRADQIEVLKSQVEFNKAKVKELIKYNDELTVLAPLDGEVSSFDLKVGEVVMAFQTLLTVTDLNDMYVRIYIPGNKLSIIKLNQKVKIKADSFPKEYFEGYISYIGAQAEYTPRNIQTPEERTKLVYPVKIQITNRENKLRDGMYVTVELQEK